MTRPMVKSRTTNLITAHDAMTALRRIEPRSHEVKHWQKAHAFCQFTLRAMPELNRQDYATILRDDHHLAIVCPFCAIDVDDRLHNYFNGLQCACGAWHFLDGNSYRYHPQIAEITKNTNLQHVVRHTK